jgi:hypothetical protein
MKPTFNQLYGAGQDGIRRHLEQLERDIARHQRKQLLLSALGLITGVLFFLVLMAPFFL